MGYTIRYGPDMPCVPSKRPWGGVVWIVLIAVICLSALVLTFPEQTQRFCSALFPWLDSEVLEAFGAMREDIREGEPIMDAVTAFCRELIHDSQQIR